MRASSLLVCSSGLTSSQYFSRIMPVSTKDFSTRGRHLQKAFYLFLGAEAHHALDVGPVAPTAIEDHDLPGCWQMRDVALSVHLRLFALGRRGKCDHPEDARADAFCHGFDRAALAGAVATLEQDADLHTLVLAGPDLRGYGTTHC